MYICILIMEYYIEIQKNVWLLDMYIFQTYNYPSKGLQTKYRELHNW